jgi:hypothetical protein
MGWREGRRRKGEEREETIWKKRESDIQEEREREKGEDGERRIP